MAENTTVTDQETFDPSIEKESYSKLSYHNLEKTRLRGAEYGVEIPHLRYKLTGSRQSTLALKVMTIFTGVMIAVGIAFLLWAVFALLIPLISAAAATTEGVADLHRIPLLNLITDALAAIVWVIAISLPLMGIAAVVSCVVFLLSLIRINHFTAEEKALSYLIGKIKAGALIYGIAAIAIGIAILVVTNLNIYALPFLIVCLLIGGYGIALFVVLQIERNHAKAWFKTLPEEQQENFKAHFKKIGLVHSHRESSKLSRSTRTNWGNSKYGLILMMLEQFIEAGFIYHNVKNTPYRSKSTALGYRALSQWLLMVGASALSVAGMYYMFTSIGSGVFDFFAIILGFSAVIIAVYTAIIMLPSILNCSIKQILLNKKFIGWLGLFLALATIVVLVVVVFMLANS